MSIIDDLNDQLKNSQKKINDIQSELSKFSEIKNSIFSANDSLEKTSSSFDKLSVALKAITDEMQNLFKEYKKYITQNTKDTKGHFEKLKKENVLLSDLVTNEIRENIKFQKKELNNLSSDSKSKVDQIVKDNSDSIEENKKIFEYAFDNLKESINKTITSELNKNNEQISYTADVLGKKLEEVNKTLKLLNITIEKVEDSDKQKINQKIDKIEKVLSKINEKVHEKKGFW